MYDLIILYKQDIDREKLVLLLKYVVLIEDETLKRITDSATATSCIIGSFPLEIAEMKNMDVQTWASKLNIEVFSKIDKQTEGNKKHDTKSRIQSSHN